MAQNYSIIKHLGRKLYCDMYLVRKGNEGNDLIMKKMKCPKEKNEYEAELETLQKLKSRPYFPEIVDHAMIGHSCYIVMTNVGTSLEKLIEDKSKFSNSNCVRIARQMFDAIDSLHKSGVVHRNIDDLNLMFKVHKGKCVVQLANFQWSDVLYPPSTFPHPNRYTSIYVSGGDTYKEHDDFISGMYLMTTMYGTDPFTFEDIDDSVRGKREFHANPALALPNDEMNWIGSIYKTLCDDRENNAEIKIGLYYFMIALAICSFNPESPIDFSMTAGKLEIS